MRIFLSARYYVSTQVDAETRRRLASGDVEGTPQEPEEEFPEGVVARRSDGQRTFHTKDYMDVVKLRNRGKD